MTLVGIGEGIGGLELALAFPELRVELHNFGMPRTGDLDYAVAMNSSLAAITRMTHQNDIVPHLPPQEFGFHHIPTEARVAPAARRAPEALTCACDAGVGFEQHHQRLAAVHCLQRLGRRPQLLRQRAPPGMVRA